MKKTIDKINKEIDKIRKETYTINEYIRVLKRLKEINELLSIKYNQTTERTEKIVIESLMYKLDETKYILKIQIPKRKILKTINKTRKEIEKENKETDIEKENILNNIYKIQFLSDINFNQYSPYSKYKLIQISNRNGYFIQIKWKHRNIDKKDLKRKLIVEEKKIKIRRPNRDTIFTRGTPGLNTGFWI